MQVVATAKMVAQVVMGGVFAPRRLQMSKLARTTGGTASVADSLPVPIRGVAPGVHPRRRLWIEIGDQQRFLPIGRVPHARSPSWMPGQTESEWDVQVADFVAAILENREPLVTPEEALQVNEIVDAIYESAATGAAVALA
jgi:hypothetical protein